MASLNPCKQNLTILKGLELIKAPSECAGFAVAGNASGRLAQGQFLHAKGRQTADLWLTLARAMGSQITSFGDPGASSGVFTEMLR